MNQASQNTRTPLTPSKDSKKSWQRSTPLTAHVIKRDIRGKGVSKVEALYAKSLVRNCFDRGCFQVT